jgi:hypothetical protein
VDAAVTMAADWPGDRELVDDTLTDPWEEQ